MEEASNIIIYYQYYYYYYFNFVTVYDDAGICISKVHATSRSLGTSTYHLLSFAVFCPCSSTFISIHAVSRSVTFWINSTFIVISNVFRFSFRPLGIVPKALSIWRPPVLCKCFFLGSLPSTPLNGSLRNFNKWRVSVGNRTLQWDFMGIGPNKMWGHWAKELTYFWRLCNSMATLRANISGREHDIHNREMALETTKCPPTLSQNCVNFGPLAAINRTIVFTYPPKSSSPSCWPAVRRANISSYYYYYYYYKLICCGWHLEVWSESLLVNLEL